MTSSEKKSASGGDDITVPMPQRHWEHFPHGADIGIRGVGATLELAFEQAALALTAVITDPQAVKPEKRIRIECEAPDDELLLVDWLNALIYEMAAGNMLFSRFEVAIRDHHLMGAAWGEKTDLPRHRPCVEVKGATYTMLSVRRDANDNWSAQCVVDV